MQFWGFRAATVTMSENKPIRTMPAATPAIEIDPFHYWNYHKLLLRLAASALVETQAARFPKAAAEAAA